MNKKGFIPILLILFVMILLGILGGGYYLYYKTPFSLSIRSNNLDYSISTIVPASSPYHKSSNNPTSPPASSPVAISPIPAVTGVLQDTDTIKIKGDKNCVEKTQEALGLLQSKVADHYNTVDKYVAIIECTTQGSGMYAWETPPRYQVGKATIEAGTIWYAGTIIHDSCHSKQYHDYLSANNSATVPDKVWTGKEAEKQCLDIQYDALSRIGADQSTLDYVKNIINSQYWDVSYNNRWW